MIVLAILTGLLGILARIAIGRAAKASGRVDHYYWMLAAEAYRTQRGLPVHLPGKYLMEDEAQGYPPLFGLLLGRWRLDRGGVAAVIVLELMQAVVLAALMSAFGAARSVIALAVAIYAAAPVLVMYNTQLNSRILGDLFLFAAMAAEVSAAFVVPGSPLALVLWCAAALLTALVIMTHKMTLQLRLALLLPWAWALGTPMPIAVCVAGLAVYVAIVGTRFARYQFLTHWEFIRFWNRHWPALGAHQFRDSLVYGGGLATSVGRLHQPGLRGALRQLRVVLAYAPLNLVLPLASMATATWPPNWLLVWLLGIYAWALATLVIPRLKCLGGGHLYVFNAVAPGACYLAFLPEGPVILEVLGVGILITAASLWIAWRMTRARTPLLDEKFSQAVAVLGGLPKGRVAVLPTQGAEAVAWATHHAVLWGAHGYGLAGIEGFFPVLTKPLSAFLRQYNIDMVLSDDRFWRIGADTLRAEGVPAGREQVFGHWRLTWCQSGAADVS